MKDPKNERKSTGNTELAGGWSATGRKEKQQDEKEEWPSAVRFSIPVWPHYA